MSETTETAKPKRKRPILKWTLRSLGFFVGILVLAWLVYAGIGRWQLNQALAELKRTGQPTSFDEVYQARDQEKTDAGYRLINLSRVVGDITYAEDLPIAFNDMNFPWFDSPWPEEMYEQSRTALKRVEPLLDELDRVEGLDEALFPWENYRESFFPLSLELPGCGSARYLSKWLATRSRVRAHDGDVKGALQDIQRIRQMSGMLERDGITISWLVGGSIRSLSVGLIYGVLAEPVIDDSALRQIDEILQQESYTQYYQEVIQTELAFEITTQEMLWNHWAESEELNQFNFEPYTIFYKYSGRWRYNLSAMITSAKQWKSLDLTQPFNHHFQKGLTVPGTPFDIDFEFVPSFTDEKFGPMEAVVIVSYRVDARETAMRTLIAVRRYQLSNNAWPSDLNDLVPKYLKEIPTDPFDGKPIRLITADNSITIYSIGKDLQDNEGNPEKDIAYSLVIETE